MGHHMLGPPIPQVDEPLGESPPGPPPPPQRRYHIDRTHHIRLLLKVPDTPSQLGVTDRGKPLCGTPISYFLEGILEPLPPGSDDPLVDLGPQPTLMWWSKESNQVRTLRTTYGLIPHIWGQKGILKPLPPRWAIWVQVELPR